MENLYMQALATQNKLTRAFALMRKRGLVARQRYKCCGSCAGYALAVELAAKVTEGSLVKDKFKGCCFYSKQGGFFDRSDDGTVGSCYLRFGQVDTSEHGPLGLPTVEVGKLICECLTEAGVAFVWDGTEDMSIEVLPTPPEPKTSFERVLQPSL
jgi:hypothetical protein